MYMHYIRVPCIRILLYTICIITYIVCILATVYVIRVQYIFRIYGGFIFNILYWLFKLNYITVCRNNNFFLIEELNCRTFINYV